jgi:hypothetical protein
MRRIADDAVEPRQQQRDEEQEEVYDEPTVADDGLFGSLLLSARSSSNNVRLDVSHRRVPRTLGVDADPTR